MAGQGSGEEPLNRIVKLIAADRAAEVRSCHIARGGDRKHRSGGPPPATAATVPVFADEHRPIRP
jgi:hypothetical protein